MTKSGRKTSKSTLHTRPASPSKHKSSNPSKSSSKRRSSSKRKSKPKKAKLPGNEIPAVMSEEEYFNLPPCIQRKYFSSLERLHIAYSAVRQSNQSISKAHPRGPNADNTTPIAHRQFNQPARSPTPHHINSPTRSSHYSCVYDQHLNSSRVKSSQVSFGDVLAIQTEAQWFGSLPEKVRSQLFDREEQELLFSALEPYTAPHHPETKDKTKSHSTSRHRKSPSPHKSCPTPQLSPTKMSSNKMPQHQHRREALAGEETETSQGSRQADMGGLRRRLTLTQPVLQSVGLTTSPSPTPKSPILPGHFRDRSHGTLASLSRPSIDTTVPAIDPEAVYYRSPEARQKLRQYLASPQRFDEALTYGFPSDAQPEQTSPSYRYPSCTAHNDAKAFLVNDLIPFIDHSTAPSPDLEDEESYETSDNDTDSPATPRDGNFAWQASKYNRLSIFGGLNSDSMPSLDLNFQPELLSPRVSSPTFGDALLNREMTLRMTLTRPDLRANEEEIYGWRKSSPDGDPLALSELPTPIEDSSGAQGAFAIPPARPRRDSKVPTIPAKPTKVPGGFSRFLNKIRRH